MQTQYKAMAKKKPMTITKLSRVREREKEQKGKVVFESIGVWVCMCVVDFD